MKSRSIGVFIALSLSASAWGQEVPAPTLKEPVGPIAQKNVKGLLDGAWKIVQIVDDLKVLAAGKDIEGGVMEIAGDTMTVSDIGDTVKVGLVFNVEKKQVEMSFEQNGAQKKILMRYKLEDGMLHLASFTDNAQQQLEFPDSAEPKQGVTVIRFKKLTAEELKAHKEQEKIDKEKKDKEAAQADPDEVLGQAGIPVAKAVPGREGFVFNPHTGNMVDVRGLPSGTLVMDPMDKENRKFRLP